MVIVFVEIFPIHFKEIYLEADKCSNESIKTLLDRFLIGIIVYSSTIDRYVANTGPR